jgi:LPXTG-site transpeptidase (sortase) family protein
MYRRHTSSGQTLILVVVLGVVIGLVYLIVDTRPRSQIQPITPAVTPSPLPATAAADASATPLPPREITDSTRFTAPTAGITGDVIETYLDGTSWDVTNLGQNVGHLQGTAWLNEPGNIVLAGHVELRDGRRGIFADLDRLDIGDPIYMAQADDERLYQVTQKFFTEPTNLTVMYPAQTERLTLITCTDYDFFADEYRQRLVVIAERVG